MLLLYYTPYTIRVINEHMLVVIFACKSGIYRHRSLIMFSCKHELAPVATHPRNLTGRRSNNDDQPTRLLGVISLQTKELHPSNFACSLLSPAPLARKKKGFSRDGNANSTKTAYILLTKKFCSTWLVGVDWRMYTIQINFVNLCHSAPARD